MNLKNSDTAPVNFNYFCNNLIKKITVVGYNDHAALIIFKVCFKPTY